MRNTGRRADAQDNRRRLLDAVGRLLAGQGTLTLTELAAEAGVSRATTYRNFATPAAAIDAFVEAFITEFETAVAGPTDSTVDGPDGTDPLQALSHLCAAWGELVDQYSHALIHVRSTEGFLARARADDPIIGRIYRLVRSTVDHAMARGTITGIDPDYAVFLWNLLLDPRELLDLAEHNHQTIPEATAQLTTDYLRLLHPH